MITTDTTPPRPERWTRARALVARAAAMERVVYASIGRAIVRRPAVPSGARGFRFHAPVLTILLIFIVLSAVELVVIDLIVHRWLAVRIALLAIGIWGLVWMIGLLCAYYVRPHTVGPEGIEIRDGLDLDVRVRWDDVHSVALRKHTFPPKTPKVVAAAGGRHTLAAPILHETNIEIVLERPTSIAVPGTPPKGGVRTIDAVRLWADDPRAFLEAVRDHIP